MRMNTITRRSALAGTVAACLAMEEGRTSALLVSTRGRSVGAAAAATVPALGPHLFLGAEFHTALDEADAGLFEGAPDCGDVGRDRHPLPLLEVGDGSKADAARIGELLLGQRNETAGCAALGGGDAHRHTLKGVQKKCNSAEKALAHNLHPCLKSAHQMQGASQ